MTDARALPEWAETVLRNWGPQPVRSELPPSVDATDVAERQLAALARYAVQTERFRRRWWDLEKEVWSRFGDAHSEQRGRLFGFMIDWARYGSRSELAAKRDAMRAAGEEQEKLYNIAEGLETAINNLSILDHEHGIESGLDPDDLEELRVALERVTRSHWLEPRLYNSNFTEAINSRKTARDALNLMLEDLRRYAFLLAPVKLTDRALATIFNVAHDADDAESYDAPAVKKARADLRRR